jgi:peroxiredoxin
MAEPLAALPVDGAGGAPLPLIVSTGEVAENRKLAVDHGIRCPILMQDQMEVGALYECHGTQMGYLIDAQGQIASEMAVGADALLALAQRSAPGAASPDPSSGNGVGPLGGTRTLAESKIQRNGLAAGTPAPGFRLPRLDGGELALKEYRGRKVLLVFSDPKCGPCDALAPRLEEAHRRSGDVQVLMVSRGEVEANQAKVEQHGLTLPMVLQNQWEVSREYAMFATPVGYLIGERGTIAEDAASGADAILALLAAVAAKRCKCGKPQRECRTGEGGCASAKAAPAVAQRG